MSSFHTVNGEKKHLSQASDQKIFDFNVGQTDTRNKERREKEESESFQHLIQFFNTREHESSAYLYTNAALYTYKLFLKMLCFDWT